MPAYNFRACYADAVERGLKEQTIRAPRKDNRGHARPGDRLFLYVGMRTRGCRKLREATCTGRHTVVIDAAADGCPMIWIDGIELNVDEVERFARADGFETVSHFTRFFREAHGLPFSGSLIRWNSGAPAWVGRPGSMLPYALPEYAGKPYRPSNGTEGDLFESRWCGSCMFRGDCLVIPASMALDAEDPEYPAELRYDLDGNPTCKAWAPSAGQWMKVRRMMTMFAGPSIRREPTEKEST